MRRQWRRRLDDHWAEMLVVCLILWLVAACCWLIADIVIRTWPRQEDQKNRIVIPLNPN